VSVFRKIPPGFVLRCPTAAENGVMSGGVVSGRFDLRLRRITSSPSQTLHRRLVRTKNDGRRRDARLDAVRRGFIMWPTACGHIMKRCGCLSVCHVSYLKNGAR